MIATLRFLDSGPYHAALAATVPFSYARDLRVAMDLGYVVHGRFGFTLTVRGFYQAFPDFKTGE